MDAISLQPPMESLLQPPRQQQQPQLHPQPQTGPKQENKHYPQQQHQQQHSPQPTLIPSPNASPKAKKKSRLSYSINFKLAAVRHAESHGNRATARYLGINEKQIRDWRSKKSSLLNTNANAKRLKGAGRQSSISASSTKLDNNKLSIIKSSMSSSTAENSEEHRFEIPNPTSKHSSTIFLNNLPTPVSILNHNNPYQHHQHQSSYDFSWWGQCLPRNGSTITKEETDSVASSLSPSNSSSSSTSNYSSHMNNNNNYVAHSIESIIEPDDAETTLSRRIRSPPQMHFSPTDNTHNQTVTHPVRLFNDNEGEQELKEKISCALALLELKKTSKRRLSSFGQYHYQNYQPVITW